MVFNQKKYEMLELIVMADSVGLVHYMSLLKYFAICFEFDKQKVNRQKFLEGENLV
ncbi:MAG: hypothetical protein PHU45_02745 [Bacilli bacterium]|nr:hypothetical protein [Bacilli bacterium]